MFRLTRPTTIVCAVLVALGIASCSDIDPTEQQARAAMVHKLGDPHAGQELILRVGCGSCHEIPGILGADGLVGPPLAKIARRQYIAGVLRNTPDNMVHWLQHPQQVVPGNAMPEMGLSDQQARQIAAYLYTLQ